MSTRIKVLFSGVGLAFALAVAFLGNMGGDLVEGDATVSLPEHSRSELELRDGVLYLIGGSQAFEGTMVEVFPGGRKRTAIAIHEGLPHGVSRGWYENGQLEVEEHFIRGVSHGRRTRWYASGAKKSEAQIAHGNIEGLFTRYHENGRVAVEAQMNGGVADGLSKAWHPSGQLKSRVVLKMGEILEREFFDQQGNSRSPQSSS